MKLMQALSKTDQVANFLREGIQTEKLLPGTKLQSSRTLAAKFATSKMVIESACTILEKEGLVFKRARSGVFVNKLSELSHLKEVYILGAKVRDGEPYFHEVLKLASTSFARDNLTFIARTYPPDISVSKILDIEKIRISKMNEIDCILISAVKLKASEIHQCLDLGKPIIFLGDFSSSEMQSIELNQITGDNTFHGKEQTSYMLKKNLSDITLCTGSLQHLFNQQFRDGVQIEAESAGLSFNILEFPQGLSILSENELISIYSKILQEAINNKTISGGIIMSGVNAKLIKNLLAKLDIRLYDELSFMPQCHIDYRLLRKAIIARIAELVAKDDKTRKIILKLPMIITKEKSKNNHKSDFIRKIKVC